MSIGVLSRGHNATAVQSLEPTSPRQCAQKNHTLAHLRWAREGAWRGRNAWLPRTMHMLTLQHHFALAAQSHPGHEQYRDQATPDTQPLMIDATTSAARPRCDDEHRRCICVRGFVNHATNPGKLLHDWVSELRRLLNRMLVASGQVSNAPKHQSTGEVAQLTTSCGCIIRAANHRAQAIA